MSFLGAASRAAWFTAISLVSVLVSAVAASGPATANPAHVGAIDGFTYDAPADTAISRGFEATASMVPAVDSQWSARLAMGVVGHVYDPPFVLVAPTSALDDAASAANGARLNAQLAADEIAGGHAFTKHVVEQGEFPGIRTRAQFADMVETVITDYTDIRHLDRGRTAYWRDGVVVIRNPSAADGGTAFVPRDGYDYFLNDLN